MNQTRGTAMLAVEVHYYGDAEPVIIPISGSDHADAEDIWMITGSASP